MEISIEGSQSNIIKIKNHYTKFIKFNLVFVTTTLKIFQYETLKYFFYYFTDNYTMSNLSFKISGKLIHSKDLSENVHYFNYHFIDIYIRCNYKDDLNYTGNNILLFFNRYKNYILKCTKKHYSLYGNIIQYKKLLNLHLYKQINYLFI